MAMIITSQRRGCPIYGDSDPSPGGTFRLGRIPDEPPLMKRVSRAHVAQAFAWAEISEDRPPEIWNIAWYRKDLRQDLRHIRVKIVPVQAKRKLGGPDPR